MYLHKYYFIRIPFFPDHLKSATMNSYKSPIDSFFFFFASIQHKFSQLLLFLPSMFPYPSLIYSTHPNLSTIITLAYPYPGFSQQFIPNNPIQTGCTTHPPLKFLFLLDTIFFVQSLSPHRLTTVLYNASLHFVQYHLILLPIPLKIPSFPVSFYFLISGKLIWSDF